MHLDFKMNSLSVEGPETVMLDYLHGAESIS